MHHFDVVDLIGTRLQEAIQVCNYYGYSFVVQESRAFEAQYDHNPTRINICLDEGVVVRAYLG